MYDTQMNSVPECIGIIIDGNRRWAKEQGLPKLEGHRRGYEKVLDTARWVRDRGIRHMVVYAFSTENWNREKEEVDYLMALLLEMAQQPLDKLSDENVRVRFIGVLEMLPEELRQAIARIEERSKEHTALTLWICLSYGGRAEIVAAVKAAAGTGEEITEESLHRHFWSAEMPDPDIIIRTGGEQRLSNFLLWQVAYSELAFIKPFWPEFSEELLDGILEDFAGRSRRMGA